MVRTVPAYIWGAQTWIARLVPIVSAYKWGRASVRTWDGQKANTQTYACKGVNWSSGIVSSTPAYLAVRRDGVGGQLSTIVVQGLSDRGCS